MTLDFIPEVDESGPGQNLVESGTNENSSFSAEKALHSSHIIVADMVFDSKTDENGHPIDNFGNYETSSTDSFADKIGDLQMSRLNLRTFPQTALEFSRIMQIDLSFNKLQEIPSVFLCNKFENVGVLKFAYNKVKHFPEEIGYNFPKLYHLNISSNQIVMLPLSLRNCKLDVLQCSDNPFHFALQGIIGGNLSASKSDWTASAINMRYFFGLVEFYISLDESTCESIEGALRNWGAKQNFRADVFLELVNAYRAMYQGEAAGNNDNLQLQMYSRWAFERFSEVVPGEVRKFNYVPSMESLDSLLCWIDETLPVKTTQDVEEDVEEGDIEDADIEMDKNNNEIQSVQPPTPTWTRKERAWFLSGITLVGFILCFFIIWPLLTSLLVSPDGLELLRREYIPRIIPYSCTSYFAQLHSRFHDWILEYLPVSFSQYFPLIDYKFPFWKKVWIWMTSLFYKK